MEKTDDHKQEEVKETVEPVEEQRQEENSSVQEIVLSLQEFDALKAQEERAREMQERMIRLQADFDNARKRLDRDKQDFLKFANDELIGELIPFVDDFQRAFAAADTTQDFQVLHQGVEMILKHLQQLLERKGVRPIEAQGKPFDPQIHEAMLQVETDEYPENTVIEELQKGYMLSNRVLRTAKVKVAKAPEAEVQANSENQETESEEDRPQGEA